MISTKQFITGVQAGNQTEAQIKLITEQVEIAFLEAKASRTIPKYILIKGIKKGDVTTGTKVAIEASGYKIAQHLIGGNPEELRLVL